MWTLASPLRGSTRVSPSPCCPSQGKYLRQSVLLLPLSGEVPASVRPLAAPFRGSTRVSPSPCCPSQGKYLRQSVLLLPLSGEVPASVRPLAAPLRGSTRVAGEGVSKPFCHVLRRDSSPTRGAKGALGIGPVVSCPPPYPPPMEGVAVCSPMDGVHTSFRPDRSFYLFY